MKYFILYIINWLIVMVIMYLLVLIKHYDILSYVGGIITSIIVYFNCWRITK